MEKLTVAQIRQQVKFVWGSGNFEPFEESNTDWQDGLWEMCDKGHIGEEGVLAALETLENDFLDEGQSISYIKFEKFMDEAFKQSHDSKGSWAKEQAYEFLDAKTLDRMEDYINWSEYAESYTDAYVFIEGPSKVYVFDADFEF
ncbi:hypothetical protein [Streptomyces atratus]|uniref:hypothetical protein n=1 Tax=Streptomyces atratus TaxID=1893 RepID=UPI0036528258